MAGGFNLERFVEAQAPVYPQVRAELRAGKKTSHWIWFIFPQLSELGRSATAHYYGIASLEEAVAYWEHDLLGPRLRECAELVLTHAGKAIEEVLGPPDDLKFRSSMTLFELAAPEEPVFGRALDVYFRGERDGLTLRLIEEGTPGRD